MLPSSCRMEEVLSVEVLSASGLRDTTVLARQSPLVQLHVMPSQSGGASRTKPCDSGHTDPEWKKQHENVLEARPEPTDHTLLFEILAQGLLSDTVIGKAEVSIDGGCERRVGVVSCLLDVLSFLSSRLLVFSILEL